ncbi:four helix bundle protein [Candidatus Parcubacteria bacterium]|nr:MAG: four helix bundle protein [Candidatus Parcubacteria bacterium]
MESKFLMLGDLNSYCISFGLSNYVWGVVVNWDNFSKITVGKQFVRSVDSISANTAEGFGRYNKKDKIKFYRYSFGSVKESLDWNQKAFSRNLINKQAHSHIYHELDKMPKRDKFIN